MNKTNFKTIKLMLHTRPIFCAEYSLDGQFIFTAAQDSYVKVTCAYTGQLIEQYGPHVTATGTAIKSISVTTDARYIAVGLNIDKVIIHDRQNKSAQKEVFINQRGVRVVQFNKLQNALFVITTSEQFGETKKAQLIKYSFPELQVIKQKTIAWDCKCCILSPDDTQLWVGTENSIIMFDTETLEQLFEEETGSPVSDLQIYKNAFIVAPFADASCVYFYSMRELTDVYQFRVHNRVNTATVNEHNGIMVIGGGLDPKIVAQVKEGNNVMTQFYDVVFKEMIAELELHSGPTHRIRWSPDGCSLVSVSEDGSVVILRFGKELIDYKYDCAWV